MSNNVSYKLIINNAISTFLTKTTLLCPKDSVTNKFGGKKSEQKICSVHTNFELIKHQHIQNRANVTIEIYLLGELQISDAAAVTLQRKILCTLQNAQKSVKHHLFNSIITAARIYCNIISMGHAKRNFKTTYHIFIMCIFIYLTP